MSSRPSRNNTNPNYRPVNSMSSSSPEVQSSSDEESEFSFSQDDGVVVRGAQNQNDGEDSDASTFDDSVMAEEEAVEEEAVEEEDIEEEAVEEDDVSTEEDHPVTPHHNNDNDNNTIDLISRELQHSSIRNDDNIEDTVNSNEDDCTVITIAASNSDPLSKRKSTATSPDIQTKKQNVQSRTPPDDDDDDDDDGEKKPSAAAVGAVAVAPDIHDHPLPADDKFDDNMGGMMDNALPNPGSSIREPVPSVNGAKDKTFLDGVKIMVGSKTATNHTHTKTMIANFGGDVMGQISKNTSKYCLHIIILASLFHQSANLFPLFIRLFCNCYLKDYLSDISTSSR